MESIAPSANQSLAYNINHPNSFILSVKRIRSVGLVEACTIRSVGLVEACTIACHFSLNLNKSSMSDIGNYTMEGRDIQPSKNLYPNCILWSPLPPITWLLPFIGHTGIADSQGVIHDFAGPYHIGEVVVLTIRQSYIYMLGVGKMAFGSPTRYIQLDPVKCRDMSWDDGVHEGCTICKLKHKSHAT